MEFAVHGKPIQQIAVRALKKFGMRFFLTSLRCVYMVKIHDNVSIICCISWHHTLHQMHARLHYTLAMKLNPQYIMPLMHT